MVAIGSGFQRKAIWGTSILLTSKHLTVKQNACQIVLIQSLYMAMVYGDGLDTYVCIIQVFTHCAWWISGIDRATVALCDEHFEAFYLSTPVIPNNSVRLK